jgi:hypothetical protein
MKTHQKTLRLSDLRAGLAEADRVIEETSQPAIVASSSGRHLALISVALGSANIPDKAIAVDGEVFRQRRTTIVYGALLGLVFVVRQKGKTFLISPPEEPDDLLPRPFESSGHASATLADALRAPLTELQSRLDPISARIEGVAAKIDAISGASSDRLAEEVRRRVEAEARIEDLVRKIGALEERLKISNFTPTKSKRKTIEN